MQTPYHHRYIDLVTLFTRLYLAISTPSELWAGAQSVLSLSLSVPEKPTLADAIDASDDLEIITRMDAQDDVDAIESDGEESDSDAGGRRRC